MSSSPSRKLPAPVLEHPRVTQLRGSGRKQRQVPAADDAATTPNRVSAAARTKSTVTADAASCPIGQFKASYFANQTLSGTPATERCESAVDYDWGYGSPSGANVGPDDFSVRWV